MIHRQTLAKTLWLLDDFPAVAILGPRQVGKTTLADEIRKIIYPTPIYLDLERPSDLAKLNDPELYFQEHADRLIILDEVQRLPGIFQLLRSIIDERRRAGLAAKQFLLLGSASLELLQQSSESLAGRISYLELPGLTISEVMQQGHNSADINQLWLRGGFPDSFLASTDEKSFKWRQEFIRSYLERDIPQFGVRTPAETLRRFWTMLAHNQGTLWNASKLATSLVTSVPSINRYLDLLVDLLLVHSLRPWSGNIGKRLIKAPKVYIRDSGLVHTLLQLKTYEEVLSHPIAGTSWEGFVIENLCAGLPSGATTWFYRTSAGAEIDLLIEYGASTRIAIEIKRSLSPKLSKGFLMGSEDVQATHKYVIYPGHERYSLAKNIEAIPVMDLNGLLK